jgi:CelD/BcsL family acetyltransferase involved in cellulose biosynthesis
VSVQVINPLTFPGWDELVLEHQGCTFFHSSAWARVLHESYGFRPVYFTVFADDTLSSCLPVMEINSRITGRRGVSLPFSDYCEPLTSTPDLMKSVFAQAVEYGSRRGWKSLEVRGGGPFLDGKPSSSEYLVHVLKTVNGSTSCETAVEKETSIQDLVFSGFGASTRRNIRNSLGKGVTVEISTDSDAIKEFCRLNQLTRKAHGVPPQPYHFFRRTYDHVISKGHGFVALARYRNLVVAASIFFRFGKNVIYKFGASDARWHYLRPNNLVMWEAIRSCCDTGCAEISFGRTDLGHEGLRRYKTGWGAKERRVEYHRFSFDSATFDSRRPAFHSTRSAIFTRMPLPLLRAIGALAYRHIG